MMTRKNYEAAAAEVRGLQWTRPEVKLLVANTFADFFAKDNPRFDQDRFFAACFPQAQESL